jgi:hypothetical protein
MIRQGSQREWTIQQLALMAAVLQQELDSDVELLLPRSEAPRIYVPVGVGGRQRFMLMLGCEDGHWYWSWGRGTDRRTSYGTGALEVVLCAIRACRVAP